MNVAYAWNDAAADVMAWNRSGSTDVAELTSEAVAFLDAALARYVASRWSQYPAKDDLRQTAWLRLFRSLRLMPDYSRRNFRAWFYTQARWACGDAYRSLNEPTGEAVAFDFEPASPADESASRSAFRELVEGLPDREAVALELRFLVGWELHEIGDAFEITPAGAGNIVYAALKRLRSGQSLQAKWRTRRDGRRPKTIRGKRSRMVASAA